MYHPGPPRFAAVGHDVELAPRDPDPDATYRWRIKSAPVVSQAELGDAPVEHFVPDAAGRYTIELNAPDGLHTLTVRVFPGELAPAGTAEGAGGYSGASGVSGFSGVSGVSGVSDASGLSGSGSGDQAIERAPRGGRPRIQLWGHDEGDVVRVEARVKPHPDDDRDPDEVDVEFVLDDRDAVRTADVEIDDRAVRIPKAVVEDRVRIHAVAVTNSYSVPDSMEVHRTPEGVEPVPLNVPPDWSKGVTLYEIYVRGFASDDEEAATTFEALEKRLEYLDDLGVDCLWLTPVLQNDHAPHGYNITDFFAIAADLGTREDYESFVESAHERGMKVLFDLVLNHSARDHPFFQDAYRNPDSPHYDWYEWQESGEPGTYFEWEHIANFDYDTLAVRRHLLDAVDTWFEVADGFRCDMAWAVPKPFWQEIRERVKEKDPEFLLMDETIPYIADFHNLCFDVHFDTTLYFRMRQVGNGNEPADTILDAIEQRASVGFPDHASFMLYQENHDETRYIVECGDEAAFASAGALFTLPGVPMLYGGQELGQMGRRDPLAWDHARDEVYEHYQHLIQTRREIRALGFDGGFERVAYESDSDRVTAFARTHEAGDYVVALNFGDSPASLAVDPAVGTTNAVSGRDVATAEGLEVESVLVLPMEE